MALVLGLGFLDILYNISIIWILYSLIKIVGKRFASRNVTTTPLRGPPSKSILFGLNHVIEASQDQAALFDGWSKEYGPAFRIPGALGSSRVALCDPKACAHFYSRETFGYVQTNLTRIFIENVFGRGLLWAEGESHRRQRKALSPAFSNAAIRRLTSVFYDSSYKLKGNWDTMLEANSGEAMIDVQDWMNHVSLDSVGIAGFGHDFGSLDGKHPPVVEVFETFSSSDASYLSNLVFLLGPLLPALLKLPTEQNRLFDKLHRTLTDIAGVLLERNRKEKEGTLADETPEEKSIIGLLIKAGSSASELQMSQEEIVAQMNVLLLAGYETTSISLTWALIELSRNIEMQEKLRQELLPFSGTDPTWEQLGSGLPFLDAVVHEVLRLHPPVAETMRVATEDDILPFGRPVTIASGEKVATITIAKGTEITVPIHAMNRSEAFWGPDAKVFRPERWLEDNDVPAKEIQGHRHLLTFSDGARICLGRHFALAEFKAVLSVLIRNYRFELPDGPETKIELHEAILFRPRVAGMSGCQMPMRVSSVDE